MRHLDCEKAQEWIVADLDGTLEDDGRRVLSRHLDGCRECRDAAVAFRKIWALLASDVPDDPGQEFWENYHASFRIKLAGIPERKSMHRGFWNVGWRTAAVLAPLMAVLLLFLFGPDHHPISVVPTAAGAVNQKLLADLQEVYGPTTEETTHTAMAAYVRSGGSSLPYAMGLGEKWFEVEDESLPPHL